MRYLVITDIHGSSYYLEKALTKYKTLNLDKIIILGDILYHGPRNDLPEGYNPKEVIALLNPLSHNILAVRGNCDAEVDQMVLQFPLFDEANLHGVLLTHGHHLDEIKDDGYVLVGHYHINKISDKHVFLGSLSIPKDTHHTYGVIIDGILRSYDLLDDTLLYEVKLW